jgi:hypothetical protein
MGERLTEAQRGVLCELCLGPGQAQYFPGGWLRPLDVGGSNGSHHSPTLGALAKKGLVQWKWRGWPDPADGENSGPGRETQRGAKVYRITEAGREALKAREPDNG